MWSTSVNSAYFSLYLHRLWGAWVAQSVEWPTLDLSSGYDLRILGLNPHVRFTVQQVVCFPPSSSSCPPQLTCSLSLANKLIVKKYYLHGLWNLCNKLYKGYLFWKSYKRVQLVGRQKMLASSCGELRTLAHHRKSAKMWSILGVCHMGITFLMELALAGIY